MSAQCAEGTQCPLSLPCGSFEFIKCLYPSLRLTCSAACKAHSPTAIHPRTTGSEARSLEEAGPDTSPLNPTRTSLLPLPDITRGEGARGLHTAFFLFRGWDPQVNEQSRRKSPSSCSCISP